MKSLRISRRVKNLRKERHLSQEDLASKLGISRQSLFSVECGKSLPSLSLALRIAKFFDLLVEDIFSLNGFKDFKERKEVKMDKELIPFLRPWGELFSIHQAFDKLFEESFPSLPKESELFSKISAPLVDIYETEDEVVVKCQLPGVKPEQVEINVSSNSISLKGERKEESEEKGKEFYRKEISFGSFQRALSLPAKVLPEKAQAKFTDGILTIDLPKAEKGKKSKTVKVKVKKEK